MGYLEDVRDEILTEAAKSGSDEENIVMAKLKEVISDINNRFANRVLTTYKDFSFTSSTSPSDHTKQMPDDFDRMIEFGRYDSTTDRIIVPWEYINRDVWEARYAGVSSMQTQGGDVGRLWFFIDDNASGNSQVRVSPGFNASITARARYHARLTTDNVEKLRNTALLKDGAISRLSMWFSGPQRVDESAKAEGRFERGISYMRSHTRSHDTGMRVGQAPTINRRNAILRDLP